jgi:hypothetical protein
VAKKNPAAEPATPTLDPRSALKSLRELDEQLATIQAPVVERLERVLDALRGKSFDSLEANQTVIGTIQRLLRRLDLRVECPRCHEPAILRCRAVRNAKDGSFKFEHSRGRRTNHGGSTTIPAFRLLPTPHDARRKRKKQK